MEENIAKTKWCPMAFDSEDNQHCLVHTCMLWVQDGEIGRRTNGQIVTKDEYGDVTWYEDGHCGLINKY